MPLPLPLNILTSVITCSIDSASLALSLFLSLDGMPKMRLRLNHQIYASAQHIIESIGKMCMLTRLHHKVSMTWCHWIVSVHVWNLDAKRFQLTVQWKQTQNKKCPAVSFSIVLVLLIWRLIVSTLLIMNHRFICTMTTAFGKRLIIHFASTTIGHFGSQRLPYIGLSAIYLNSLFIIIFHPWFHQFGWCGAI